MSKADTNQASEDDDLDLQLRMIIAYARDGDPKEPKDTYVQQIIDLIRTEKLKLLAEVRERVVGEYSKYPSHYTLSDVLHDQREALAKLEAEL